MNVLKVILLLFGTISLGIGLLGIIVPGLPTTPFLILTAGLYVKSSDKLYKKLISIHFVGSYILDFKANRGMTRKNKLFAIGTMWGMIILSCIFFITSPTLILVIPAIGVIGTIVMGFLVPTVSNSRKSS